MIACGARTNDHARLEVCVPTALPRHMRARIREIRGLETDADHRGEGHARDLLQRTCIAADFTDTWLMIHVDPGEADTHMQGLVALYSSFGFIPFQASPLLMVRQSAHARAA